MGNAPSDIKVFPAIKARNLRAFEALSLHIQKAGKVMLARAVFSLSSPMKPLTSSS